MVYRFDIITPMERKRVLLTSDGVNNGMIADSLQKLVGDTPGATKIGFITTAGNPDGGGMSPHVSQLNDLSRAGYQWVVSLDVTDMRRSWRSHLDDADVVMIGGGNTYYLLDMCKRTGFDKWIADNLEKKVFVGVSAGSIILTPNIGIAGVEPADANDIGLKDLRGLSVVSFEVSPHTPEVVSVESVRRYASTTPNQIHLMDNSTAIQVNGNSIEVVSAGGHSILN